MSQLVDQDTVESTNFSIHIFLLKNCLFFRLAKHPSSSWDQFIHGTVSNSSQLVLRGVVQFRSIQVNNFTEEGWLHNFQPIKFNDKNQTCQITTTFSFIKFVANLWKWQIHYIRQFETFSCLKLIYRPQQHGLMFGSSYLNHLDMSS
jgi:hypothetical protein